MGRLDDPDRIAALERSGLLNKQVQDRLTHVCYVATQLLDCDVSQLNVITDAVQHHVAEWPRVPPRSPIDVKTSGCREVVVTGEIIAVEDTTEHPVLCRLPWTATWQGYIGAPLVFDGEVVGSLCALTVGPRRWTERDRVGLNALAELAVASLTSPK